MRKLPLTLSLLLFSLWVFAQDVKLDTLQQEYGLQSGFIDFIYDRNQGKLYLKISDLEQDFIYQSGLSQGVGSNDIGLDRGQLGDTRLVSFQLAGDKLLLVQKNTNYRAQSENLRERLAVEEAFANSVVWGFPVVDRSASSQENAWYLVDATDFLLQDVHGLSRRMQQSAQGTFKLEKSRSAIFMPRTKGFPDNTELEAILSFSSDNPGQFVRQVAIDPNLVSVRMHHSFIRLPEPGYQPRAFHPQSGYFPFSYQDYARPVNESLTQRFIPRHRLEKKDPSAAISEPVEPIVYYLDPGVPEPVRSALLDGASWWNEAFEAIGYRNAFQVKLLPEGADPLDVRYNVIQWVHRATRGWSYGASVTDPRTGEIIKGHVSLGSLRVRQDYLIAQALLAPFGESEADDELMRLALARIRQLSAHEIGHTLGLAHNFAASSYGRASVMDYPHPLFELDGERIHADNAYDVGMGRWDKAAIAYGYQSFTPQTEAQELARIVRQNQQQGMLFITDQDARGAGDAHPYASLWDNGADPLAELERVKQIRRLGLARFGAANIREKRFWSDLEEVLVPLYYFHRYQVTAAAKSLGGVEYRYGVKGEAEGDLAVAVEPKRQQQVLESLLDTLTPEFLSVSDNLAQHILPKAFGSERSRESTTGDTGRSFDRVALAASSAQHSLSLILHPQRLARLGQQHAQETAIPDIRSVTSALHDKIIDRRYQGTQALIHLEVMDLIYSNYINLLRDAKVDRQIKAAILGALEAERNYLEIKIKRGAKEKESVYRDFYRYQAKRLESLTLDDSEDLIRLPEMPPGSPI